MESWALIFQITAAFGFLATIIFSIWGSGKVQCWNEPLDKREDGNGKDENDEAVKEPLQRENIYANSVI